MVFPQRIPGLKVLLTVWAIYAAVWITLEGALWRVILLGAATMVLAMAYGWQRFLGGKITGRRRRVWLTAVSGLALGGGSGALALVFMAVKTGLHAHGPEFSPAEIGWLLSQLPLWSAAGLLAGLGLGLIWAGRGG